MKIVIFSYWISDKYSTSIFKPNKGAISFSRIIEVWSGIDACATENEKKNYEAPIVPF